MKTCSYCGAGYPDNASICAIDHTPLETPATPLPGKPHSLLGIVSFGMSVVIGCLVVALVVVAAFLGAHRTPGMRTYPGQQVVGALIFLFMAADVAALGLGIAAICQPGKNRLFAILGVVFSGLAILATGGLIIIGLMAMSRMHR